MKVLRALLDRAGAWWFRKAFCERGRCPGQVVSGVHRGRVWVGYRCARCGRVSSYSPAGPFVDGRG